MGRPGSRECGKFLRGSEMPTDEAKRIHGGHAEASGFAVAFEKVLFVDLIGSVFRRLVSLPKLSEYLLMVAGGN